MINEMKDQHWEQYHKLSRTELRQTSGDLQMTSGSTQKGVAQVRPLLCPISPGIIQEKAARRSHSATPNIDDKDSLFSDLSAPLTDKHKEQLSRLDELCASCDSANGSLKDIPHLADKDLLTLKWSDGVQLQECPPRLTGWSTALSDADMKRVNSDDDDGYSVYSDWDSYHLAGDRTTRTKPKMTEDNRRSDSTHEALNRLSCTALGTTPEGPSRQVWQQKSFWAGHFKNGGSPVEHMYDPACPTDITDLFAVRAAFRRAPAGDNGVRNTSRPQENETTTLAQCKEVKDTRSCKPVPPDLKNHQLRRNRREKECARSRSDHLTHSHSRDRPSSHRESLNWRRISCGRDGRLHSSRERHRTNSEGERRSCSHLEKKSLKGDIDAATIDSQNNNMLSEKQMLRIVRMVHSGRFEPAMQRTLVQIIPEVVGRHPSQSSVSIEEVSQETKYIAWQLKVLSPAASFPQILASIPFLRKLFFQFNFPDTSSAPGSLLPLTQRRPSTLSPERRTREPEVGLLSHRRKHRKRKPDASADPYSRRRYRRHSSKDQLDRRRSTSRSSLAHDRRLHRPFATPSEWLGRRRSAFRSGHAVNRKCLLQYQTSTVHPKETIIRSRNVGRLPRRTSPTERHRPVDGGKQRVLSHRAKHPDSYQRGALSPLRPKATRIGVEQSRQSVDQVVGLVLDSVSNPSVKVITVLNSFKDRDSSDVSTNKTNVSKDEIVTSAPQSNIDAIGNRSDNPTMPNNSNPVKQATDISTTCKTITNAQPKPPNLLSIQHNITPLLDFYLGRQLPGVEVSRPVLLPRPPLLSTARPPSAFLYKRPLFPTSSSVNCSPQRWPRYNGPMAWRLPSPPQMMRPVGNHVHSGVKPFL